LRRSGCSPSREATRKGRSRGCSCFSFPCCAISLKIAGSNRLEEGGQLWLALGEILQVLADFSGAGEAFDHVLCLEEERYGPTSLQVAQALNLSERGMPQPALSLLERA